MIDTTINNGQALTQEIDAYIQKHGMSRASFFREANLPGSLFYLWKAGRGNPSIDSQLKVKGVLSERKPDTSSLSSLFKFEGKARSNINTRAFANKIKRFLKRNNLSPNQFFSRLDMHSGNLYNWATGKNGITKNTYEMINNAMKNYSSGFAAKTNENSDYVPPVPVRRGKAKVSIKWDDGLPGTEDLEALKTMIHTIMKMSVSKDTKYRLIGQFTSSIFLTNHE